MFRNLKMLLIICIAITEVVLLAACHSNLSSVKKDDTTATLQILLDSAFYKHRLEIAAQLSPFDLLKDTLIFKRNDTLIRHLPNNLHYKLLTEDEMCKLMTLHQKTNLQFLDLDEFRKTSNGYRLALGTHCMYKGTETESDGTSHSICERDKYCNAVFYMDMIKKGNNLTGSKFYIMTY